MNIANVMCFARGYNSVEKQYKFTEAEFDLINEFDVDHTFLLEYDALCFESYQKLFKERATERTEIGLWYEIVEPLTTACGMTYRTEMGKKWDYHIIPGFSMGYTLKEREILIDEAMRKFKEVFGYYPKTVASWVLDTYTVNYLTSKYDISALAICRDQFNFDAYTLMGGYFNQAYYPSKNNMFTPAQSDEYRVNVPVFRLLGPCPIHNYELEKYFVPEDNRCCTLEALWCPPECNEALFKAYYENENLGFGYAQFGQENTLRDDSVFRNLRIQLEMLKARDDILVTKMCDAGEMFKKKFPNKTPATSVVATENWSSMDLQSVYYDSEKYVANIFRYENSTFIRSFFLFDEKIKDHYLENTCTTSDAIFENMPIVDTQFWFDDNEKKNCGLVLDSDAKAYEVEKVGEGTLKVSWNDKYVIFEESRIECKTDLISFYLGNKDNATGTEREHKGNKFYVNPKPEIKVGENVIEYSYKGNTYYLNVVNASVRKVEDELIEIVPTDNSKVFYLYPDSQKGK